jgi:YesN/AraC family two-component response regulator
VEQAYEYSPSLIISDVMMPEMDDFTVCDTLKNDIRTSHIPIVLLTAKATVEDRIAGLRRGADAYLAKPFNPEELSVILDTLWTNQKRLQKYYSQKALNIVPPSRDEAESIKGGVYLETPPTETVIEDVFLTKLNTLLTQRLSEADLTAEDIGKAIGMSRSVLYAKLSALTGLSFNLYLRQLRLQRAQVLLKTTPMNISEVAYEVGFNDPGYFRRVFVEAFGMSPTEFQGKR